MSVSITPNQQPASFWQRLTGTEPKTVIKETSTTEVTSVEGGSFNFRTALRNGGIGAAIAGALGGVSLLGKVALPVIGKVASLGGLAKLAGVGGALGIATAALPIIAPKIKESPAAKAAVTGAAIGAAAGAILPLMPITLGAAIGAGVGLLVHNRRNRPAPDYTTYPGFVARPGYAPMGTASGDVVPNGLVPVTPNYGSQVGMAANPYGIAGYGFPQQGYGMPQMGYGQMASPYGQTMSPYYGQSLPMQAQQQAGVQQPMAQTAPVPVAARPAASGKPKYPNAKTWIDKAGNVRQLGTGKVLKAAAGAAAARATAPAQTAAPVATAIPAGYASQIPAGYTTPQSMLGSTGASAGAQAMVPGYGVQPGAMPTAPR
jgi:hypothetical protein